MLGTAQWLIICGYAKAFGPCFDLQRGNLEQRFAAFNALMSDDFTMLHYGLKLLRS